MIPKIVLFPGIVSRQSTATWGKGVFRPKAPQMRLSWVRKTKTFWIRRWTPHLKIVQAVTCVMMCHEHVWFGSWWGVNWYLFDLAVELWTRNTSPPETLSSRKPCTMWWIKSPYKVAGKKENIVYAGGEHFSWPIRPTWAQTSERLWSWGSGESPCLLLCLCRWRHPGSQRPGSWWFQPASTCRKPSSINICLTMTPFISIHQNFTHYGQCWLGLTIPKLNFESSKPYLAPKTCKTVVPKSGGL